MAPPSRRMSQSASPHVNLHCLQCDSQIGIFDNEWTRLTSSYVRPVHPGTHFGTEVATNKTQVVPEGVTQRSLEGCSLAEVFCTKCSAAVGQYCKAAPAAAQRNMLNQYLYKLSRTYLKSSETNKRVDPVFGYAGDAVKSTPRPNAILGASLAASARYSHTPSTRDETPANLRPVTESQRRSSAHISLQNSQETTPSRTAADTEPQDSIVLQHTIQGAQLKTQAGRMTDQEARTLEHDTQIRAISSVLETFRETLDEIKTSIEELKSQISPPRLDKPTQIDFAGGIHTTIMTLKSAQANAQELEELRAENAALRAKWDIVQSAMLSATGQPTPSSSFEVPRSSSLGKRKRDSDIPRSRSMVPSVAAIQTRSSYLEAVSSSTQMPTPQSSNHSDRQSADDATSSRISTPEQGLGSLNSHNIPNHGDQYMTQNNDSSESSSLRRSLRNCLPPDHDQHTDTASSAVRPNSLGTPEVDTQATSMALNVHETQQQPMTGLVEDSLQSSSQGDESQESMLVGTVPGSQNDEAQPQEIKEAAGREDNGRLLDSNEELPMDVDPLETSEIQSSIGKTVEAGDDNQSRSSTSLDVDGDGTTSLDTEPFSEASYVDDASDHSVPARRTRSKKKVKSTRSKTDCIIDSRSVAPEPAAVRRVLPRRIVANQQPRFEHSTPESIEQELKELDGPKRPRQPKPHIHTTTKILNKELKELGLEDWIERDKDDPEYKRVVEEARERKREQMRLAALAKSGINLPGADERTESAPTLEDAFHQAADALGVVNYEENGGKPFRVVSASQAAAKRALGTGERRKRREQREEEIRRRDMLAKQAMDMNE
ncbi:uncharacterized protein Z520_00258 [Fonsecaea multimorphosa CBS 102226]|uniref:Yippee domain-containing protein n=1 Tax=Fonsecaea multimorphosa CBS 102226 TaxID=1442371 RepID=A0A0D2J2D0_9EURO|nr:uncharacterized protein Z520_00258 [Fonsecaea multimorphosa CBS 102226]KIY03567.1 hypothetical protein Z520_00258 [Fonsecaea multimorphosa CBS 102226]OAL32269.1 hypothetical protein AYO22_00291 [Fonsecaea multimorphosa]